jgi:serine phosphatase RsbU (regulator of sigma subunit)
MPESARETILVVYDSRTIRETVSVLGIDDAYEVVELDDPDCVEETLEDVQPVLVLICAMARETTAYETCRSIKEASAGVFLPVVIYSIKAGLEEREKAFAAGADDTIQVTISPEELLFRTRSLLRIREVVVESQRRTQTIAQASAEAADIVLQLEEADRRIREQNAELERMVRELEARDARIRLQQQEIEQHLATLQKEMELASSLQINLLPSETPHVEGLVLYDRYVPAAQLCGDYYDYVDLPGGRFHVSVADVTGHGVAPALVSVQVRTRARTAVQDLTHPHEVLECLNKFMFDTFKQDFLMTMVYLVYDPQAHVATYAGAGHCPMILLPAAGDGFRELASQGMPLGVARESKYRSEAVELAPGDKLLLYTDGITEVPGRDASDIFGVERLTAAFEACRAAGGREALEDVFRAARMHSADGAFEDDVTLVLLERPDA